MKKIITLDFDDTIVNSLPSWIKSVELATKGRVKLKPHNIIEYNTLNCHDDEGNVLTPKEFPLLLDYFQQTLDFKLIPHTKLLMDYCKKHYEVQIVTARSEQFNYVINQLLEIHNLHYDKLVNLEDKVDYLNKINSFMHIDDNPIHLEGFNGYKLMMNHKHNKTYKTINYYDYIKNPDKKLIPRIYHHLQTLKILRIINTLNLK